MEGDVTSNKIIILFSRDMALAAIEGRKIATTRSQRKGEPGDTFWIHHPDDPLRDYLFRLIAVEPVPLLDVARNYYRLEGFTSSKEFEMAWRSLHRGHFTLDKDYFIHFFGRIR
jgi:hypothetical protein